MRSTPQVAPVLQSGSDLTPRPIRLPIAFLFFLLLSGGLHPLSLRYPPTSSSEQTVSCPACGCHPAAQRSQNTTNERKGTQLTRDDCRATTLQGGRTAASSCAVHGRELWAKPTVSGVRGLFLTKDRQDVEHLLTEHGASCSRSHCNPDSRLRMIRQHINCITMLRRCFGWTRCDGV
jgi:hypothetical protein